MKNERPRKTKDLNKIYRVFILTPWGHETDLKHFYKSKDAEKEFYKLVKEAIGKNDIPSRSDLESEEGKPFKITANPHILYKKSKLFAQIKFWEKTSYEYNEWDINKLEVILDVAEVN